MKTCPYCGEDNLDHSTVCYYCGRDLPAQQEDVEPTQPNRVQRRPNVPPADPAGEANTQPYYPQDPQQYGQYGPPPQQYPPSQTHTGYTQPYAPQPHQGQPSYGQQPYGQPPYGQQPPNYPPNFPPADPYAQGYAPPSAAPPGRSRMWVIAPLLIGVLLCVCLVATWAILDTTNRGVARLGSQISTSAAGVFGSPATQTPTVPDAAFPEEPTPWPTFTTAPIVDTPVPPPPADTPIPQPTEATEGTDYAEKLLSPECRAALDHLSRMTEELSSEPLKLLEDAWRSEFNLARTELATYCGTLDAASPVPSRVEAAHLALTQANNEFDQANQLFQEAVEGRDPGKFLQAAQHFGSAARNLTTALAEIRKVVE